MSDFGDHVSQASVFNDSSLITRSVFSGCGYLRRRIIEDRIRSSPELCRRRQQLFRLHTSEWQDSNLITTAHTAVGVQFSDNLLDLFDLMLPGADKQPPVDRISIDSWYIHADVVLHDLKAA